MENIIRWKNMIISFNKVHNSRRCAPCSRDSSYDSWICSVHGIWGSGNQAQWPWTQFCWVYCILVIPSINGDLQWRASRLLTTGASKKHLFSKLKRYPRTYPILTDHKSLMKKNRQNHVYDQAWLSAHAYKWRSDYGDGRYGRSAHLSQFCIPYPLFKSSSMRSVCWNQ